MIGLYLIDRFTMEEISTTFWMCILVRPTYEELAVELQAKVPFRGGVQRMQGQLIHLHRGLLYVAFCSHIVPLFII